MGRKSQPDQYVFTFGPGGVVTSVAEIEKNGRLDYEKIEKGETYRLIDGFVVKTEVDGREQEWEVYADPDGDGRWVEVGEGDGPFHVGLLDLFRTPSVGPAPNPPPVPPPALGGDEYVFEFGPGGVVTAVYERERDGRLEREEIERDESYARVGDYVIKTEIDDGRVELTYYADPDGDGVWIELAEVVSGASGQPVAMAQPLALQTFAWGQFAGWDQSLTALW